MISNNDSVPTRVSSNVWKLKKGNSSSRITDLINSVIQSEYKKLPLDCSSCKPEDQSCECSLKNILFQNTFNIDLILEENDGYDITWCPTLTYASNFFHCNSSYRIPARQACDAFVDCPNKLDEADSVCRQMKIQFLVVNPVVMIFLCSCFIVICMSCTAKRDQILNGTNVTTEDVLDMLESMKETVISQSDQNKISLDRKLDHMSLRKKVDLLEVSSNIYIQGTQLMKVLIERLNVSDNTKPVLDMLKESETPTNLKTRAISLVKPGCVRKAKDSFVRKCSPGVANGLSLLLGVAVSIATVLATPSQDVKDLCTISTMVIFYYNVIQQRDYLFDTPLSHVFYYLSAIYLVTLVLRIASARKIKMSENEKCDSCGCKFNPAWFPFFSDIHLILKRAQQVIKTFNLRRAIERNVSEMNNTVNKDDRMVLWREICTQSKQVNSQLLEIEDLTQKRRKLGRPSVLGDVLQGTVLPVLLLQSGLKLR